MRLTKRLILRGGYLDTRRKGGLGFIFVNVGEEPVLCLLDGTTLVFADTVWGLEAMINKQKAGKISRSHKILRSLKDSSAWHIPRTKKRGRFESTSSFCAECSKQFDQKIPRRT